jgi:hypothetical protein
MGNEDYGVLPQSVAQHCSSRVCTTSAWMLYPPDHISHRYQNARPMSYMTEFHTADMLLLFELIYKIMQLNAVVHMLRNICHCCAHVSPA